MFVFVAFPFSQEEAKRHRILNNIQTCPFSGELTGKGQLEDSNRTVRVLLEDS